MSYISRVWKNRSHKDRRFGRIDLVPIPRRNEQEPTIGSRKFPTGQLGGATQLSIDRARKSRTGTDFVLLLIHFEGLIW